MTLSDFESHTSKKNNMNKKQSNFTSASSTSVLSCFIETSQVMCRISTQWTNVLAQQRSHLGKKLEARLVRGGIDQFWKKYHKNPKDHEHLKYRIQSWTMTSMTSMAYSKWRNKHVPRFQEVPSNPSDRVWQFGFRDGVIQGVGALEFPAAFGEQIRGHLSMAPWIWHMTKHIKHIYD